MANTSAYVHSEQEQFESDALMMTSLLSGFHQNNSNDINSFNQTIQKLEKIESQLKEEAETFLGGYDIKTAQNIADNMGDLLAHLAMTIINGESAAELTMSLKRNDKVDVSRLQEIMDSRMTQFGRDILSKVTNNTTTSELTKIIMEGFNGKETTIKVDIGRGQIRQLGELFNVEEVQLSSRKAVTNLNDKIFRESQRGLSSSGIYKQMIQEIIRASGATKTQTTSQAIAGFLRKLKKRMIEKANSDIPFVWGQDPEIVKKAIDKFIELLRVELNNILKTEGNRMLDYSNVSGLMGEAVRAAVSKTANSTIITLQVGDVNEEQLMERVNKTLEDKHYVNKILPMVRYQSDAKQSKTDLILCNTRTKRVARAQSKNHFVSYFINENNANENNEFDNFRFRVEEATNLAGFIANLSQTKLGINLNGADLSNINKALANNLWFSRWDSAKPGHGDKVPSIVFTSFDPPDIVADFEGVMEKLLAGQITNLLGVTISPQDFNVVTGASNIFYVLNGRLEYTSTLVHKAIQQIKENNIKSLENKRSDRLVNVKISPGTIPSPKDVGDPSFLPAKLKTGSDSFGYEMGEKIINDIKITVSLGTSIKTLATSSLVI